MNVLNFLDVDVIDDVEIKIEYPEINFEEEKANKFIIYDNGRRINQQQQQQAILRSSELREPYQNLWTSKATACLISQYRKYRSMVGQSTQFRSLRDMFETISIEMQKCGYFFSPQKCENKWRVLERKYKNLVMREMMKKPGRMKHYGHWEHKRALDEIFSEKRKSVYLHESEYPSVGGSTKYALILPKPVQKPVSENSSPQPVVNHLDKSNKVIEVAEKPKIPSSDIAILVEPLNAASNITSAKNKDVSTKDRTAEQLENLFLEIKKCFDIAEKNKERRHLEKMAMRKNKLKVQEKLLKLEEKKFELEKRKILAMAQNIQLNI